MPAWDPRAIGESFHITSDEASTWGQIYNIVGTAAGVERRLVHVATETIVSVLPEWGGPLLGDKCHSVFFDNTRVRAFGPGWVAKVPFVRGAREIVEWFDADPARRKVDERVDSAMCVLTGERRD